MQVTTASGYGVWRAGRAFVRRAVLRAFYAVVGDARRARSVGRRPRHARVRGPLEAIALFPYMVRAVFADSDLRRYALRINGARIAIVVLVTAIYAVVLAHGAPPPPASEPASDDDTEVETLRSIDVGSLHVPIPANANVVVTKKGKSTAAEPARPKQPGAHFEKKRPTRLDGFAARVLARFPWLPLVSRVYAFAVLAEWLVIALSRQYDDELARRTSLAIGIVPDDEPRVPRPSVDLKWVLRKLRDRVRGSLLFVSAFPLYVVLEMPSMGHFVAPALALGWGLYWGTVFTAAKSAHAWKDADADPPPRQPFFLRPLEPTMVSHPRLMAYPRAWSFLVKSVRSPAYHAERSFGAFLGLLVVRAAAHVPLVYLAMRPFVVVAASRVIAGHDRRARLTTQSATTVPAELPSTAASSFAMNRLAIR